MVDIIFIDRFEDSRPVTFGKWLRLQRKIAGSTQKKAAEVAGISRRQWIRYEHGESEITPEAIPQVAKAAHVPYGRMMVKAGFERSNSECDVDAYLQRILDSIIDGSLAGAIEQVYNLFHEIEGDRRQQFRRPCLRENSHDFVTAALILDRLPTWLRSELIKYVQATEEDSEKFEYPLIPELRRQVYKLIGKDLFPAALQNGI